MVHNSERNTREELRDLYKQFKEIRPPRLGEIDIDLDDANIDMYEEDDYIAGLVHSFIIEGQLPDQAILIDTSIDSRIERALQTSETHREKLSEFKMYLSKIHDLANALSSACGIPIKYIEKRKIK